ncbi:MAG TPA: 30S ribosomal protein S6 [Rubricoccaceae bacterium]|nr:30S ribosomal protein S6 [Rubricoccaceae bacterium]
MPAPNGMYELMYILNPVLNAEQTKDIVARVSTYITENGGEIVEVVEMGSQRLAYPLEKKRNGYYVNVFFRAPGAFIARFDRALRINEDVLRHLILRYDAKMERHYERVRTGEGVKPIPAPTIVEETEG